MMNASTIVTLSRPAPLPSRIRYTPMPPTMSAIEQDERAGVGDDVADVEPGRDQIVGNVVPVLLRVDPLGADPHDHVARKRDGQQRPVPEPEQLRVAFRERERAPAREKAADQDRRSDDVHEEREVPAVRAHGCDDAHAHAPGFQIMSMRISTTTIEARVCMSRPVDVRLTASSSAFGPACPADASSCAFVGPSM